METEFGVSDRFCCAQTRYAESYFPAIQTLVAFSLSFNFFIHLIFECATRIYIFVQRGHKKIIAAKLSLVCQPTNIYTLEFGSACGERGSFAH